ncbi:MAG TPA: PAS domain S-box protein, partial [Allosphingosinicella sp.]|nr:PAS domain S-box protein [Allosphingosinicella sp.]
MATSLQNEESSPLDDFFENAVVGLHLVGKDGIILRANPADHEPLGYSADEYIGRHIADFHADPDVIQDILERLTRGEKLTRYRARLKAKDGSIRHVEISSSVNFRDGEFVNTRCFTVDVTEKAEAEMALRDAQQRLSVTYENVLAGIGEVDREGRFLRVNEAFCTLTGFTREELLERTFFDLTHPDDLPEDRRLFEAQVKGEGGEYMLVKRFVRNDGSVHWVEVRSSAVRREDGSFDYGIRLVQDITDRKLAEERQKLLLDELNHRVKNTLVTVQSLAVQTLKTSSTPAEFRARFEPRLMALSAAHDRLTKNRWEGANLADIVKEEIAAVS